MLAAVVVGVPVRQELAALVGRVAAALEILEVEMLLMPVMQILVVVAAALKGRVAPVVQV
jgi:hypothetical protein